MGIVFDIQRGSLRDGPGVRTTVFLKGCPLRCAWCHNPEGVQCRPQLFYQADRCVHCAQCGAVCPQGVHGFVSGIHTVDSARCIVCGLCVGACHYSGLRIVGGQMSAGEVMEEIRADLDFYRITGGGATLSGGEPLCQPEFAAEIFSLCKAEEIATCLETSGYAAWNVFEQMLALTDLLLFDFKIADAQKHRAFTGVSNALILGNLDRAYAFGASIVLRCPIIPGVNDDDEHLEAICRIDHKYPELKGIELLAYHHLGISKAASVGATQPFTRSATVETKEKESWLRRLNRMGCRRARLG